jgi:hypothetical protein
VLKRIKLATLIVVAVVLSVVSYESWQPLFVTDTPIDWSKEELDAYFPPGLNVNLTVQGTLIVASGKPDSGLYHIVTTPAKNIATFQPGSDNAIYLFASPHAARALSHCSDIGESIRQQDAGLVPQGTVVHARVEAVDEASAPPYVRESLDARGAYETPPPLSIFRVAVGEQGSSQLTCVVQDRQVARSGARYTVTMPPMHVGRAGTPPTGYREQSQLCASADVYFEGIFSLAGQYPPPDQAAAPHERVGQAPTAGWSECNDRPDAFDKNAVYLLSSTASAIDLTENDAVTRNTFVLGALVGVLGGLGVEIIGSIFETAEGPN